MIKNYNLEKMFYLYIMGQYNSYLLEDWEAPRVGHSEAGTSDWDYYDKPKNFDYYFGQNRFTYISREHYKNDYIKRYLWGRYKIKNPLDNIEDADKEEHDTMDENEYAI